MHTKRKEILFNIDPCSDLHGERLPGTDFDTRVKSSIRLGVWKVLTGRQGKSFSPFHSLGGQSCKIKIWYILSYQLFEVVIIDIHLQESGEGDYLLSAGSPSISTSCSSCWS